MFDWITHNKGLFLNSYTEIGTSHPHAMELQTQHNHFAMNCMVRHGAQGCPAAELTLTDWGVVFTRLLPSMLPGVPAGSSDDPVEQLTSSLGDSLW